MKSIGISEFKAKCISILKDLQQNQTPLIITHRGKPVARVEPIRPAGKRTLGSLSHLGRVTGDIVENDFGQEWEMEA